MDNVEKTIQDQAIPEMNRENLEELLGEEVFETVHQPDDVTE